MARKRIKVEVLFSAVTVLIVAGVGGVVVRPTHEPDQAQASRIGDVTWNHELHVRIEDISNCTVCHHKDQQGDMTPRSCYECHERPSNGDALYLADLHMEVADEVYEGEHGPPPQTAFHSRCIGCHRAMDEGPLECRDCHAQRFSRSFGTVEWNHNAHARLYDMPGEAGSDDCAYCHHQDEDATNDGEYRACSDCHEPAVASGVTWQTDYKHHEDDVHGSCHECHVDFDPDESLAGCADCHPDVVVDSDDDPLTLEQAIHDRCGSCHNGEYQGRTDTMPVGCADCHRADPTLLELPGLGTVMWSHDRHARFDPEIECVDCHHTDQPDEPHTACSRCHGTGLYDNPDYVEALTQRCLGCHDERGNGLDKWERMISTWDSPAEREQFADGWMSIEAREGVLLWNHRAHAIDYGFACRDCHHPILHKDGEWVTASEAGPAWTDEAARIQSCRNCHGPDGPVAGSPAEGTQALDTLRVFQKVCVECHQRLEGGSQTWKEFFEVEPVDRTPPTDVQEGGE